MSQRVKREGREPMFNITYAGGLRHLNGRVRRRSHQVPSHPVAILLMAMLILCPLLVTSIGTSGQSRASGDWMESSGNLPSSGMYFGICFGHINDDGDLDLVASSDGDGLRVFLGNGAGGWTPVPDHPARTGGYSGIALADFDKDGKRDIIAGSPGVEATTPNGLQIFKGDGTGAFTDVSSSTDLPERGNWRGVSVGDVNGDGILDIAATSGYGSSDGIHVFVGDGDGTFTDESSGLPQNQDRDSNVALADFNDDGDLDLAVGGGPGADVFLGNGGDGGSMEWTPASVGLPNTRFAGVSAADLDDDGLVDLILTAVEAGFTGGIYAYKNVREATGWVTMSTGLPNSGDYIENGVADLNGDGNLDIVATGGFETTFGIHVFEGDGQGTWSESSPGLPDTYYYVGLDVGDIDGEGNPDLAAGMMSGSGGVEVWMNPRGPPPGLSARLRSPVGGTSLTGGSEHRIRWSVASGTSPYSVTLSYSTDGGASYGNVIATDITQWSSGEGDYDWTVPDLDETRVRLRVEVSDSNSITASTTSHEDIEIDATAPEVISTDPLDGATDVSMVTPIIIEFSETLNRTSEQAISIEGPGDPSMLQPAWDGPVLTYQSSGLEPRSSYSVTISTTASDDSDPGNQLETDHVFTFETGALEDHSPPVADGGPDRAVDQHSLVTLNGTGSTDDVGVVNWTWRFFYDEQL
ncbi:MAG: VCBS repeat-containing protein, partial [Thermoplasmata archaeon]|nr:VCBS repeat-containing protein [Thermoplasmata archaeon]